MYNEEYEEKRSGRDDFPDLSAPIIDSTAASYYDEYSYVSDDGKFIHADKNILKEKGEKKDADSSTE